MSEGERESSGCVLGVAFGLTVFGVLLWVLGRALVSPLDGEAQLGEWFEERELPFGLVVAQGVRTDVLTVILENPDAPEEAPKHEVPKDDEEQDDEEQQDDDFDWSAIEVGPKDTDPIEVVIEHHPKADPERLERLFGRPGGDDEDRERADLPFFGARGGRATMDRGRLPWGSEYSVVYIHERELEPGGTFRDLMRANLTLPGRVFVVSARWPRGYPASKDKMQELIAALRPRPPE